MSALNLRKEKSDIPPKIHIPIKLSYFLLFTCIGITGLSYFSNRKIAFTNIYKKLYLIIFIIKISKKLYIIYV